MRSYTIAIAVFWLINNHDNTKITMCPDLFLDYVNDWVKFHADSSIQQIYGHLDVWCLKMNFQIHVVLKLSDTEVSIYQFLFYF
jgi:hypothetical protein